MCLSYSSTCSCSPCKKRELFIKFLSVFPVSFILLVQLSVVIHFYYVKYLILRLHVQYMYMYLDMQSNFKIMTLFCKHKS